MPIASRTFRVFVSSTFNDLIEERNALQRDVFPELTKICEAHGARFQAIDLRWGVSGEAVLGQRMIEICLAEIERCQQTKIKPNFIVLLADRYGEPPLPARIQEREFATVFSQVSDATSRALADRWYERDENALPPEYLLRARTGQFVDEERWKQDEGPLRDALMEGARAAGLTRDELLKYEGSASHQEIVKGLGKTAEDRKHVFAFFRKNKTAGEPPELRNLTEFLRGELGEGVFEYDAGDIAKLCDAVRESLSKVIVDEVSRFKSRPALDLEIGLHDGFAKDRDKHFVGRRIVLDAVDDYLKSGDRRPLVIHGASGSGKSAIMARASSLEGVIRRFIGVTPESSHGITLLRGLCQEIARRYGQPEDVPATFSELAGAFSDQIILATPERPLVLFVDALDQLGPEDPAASMSWLPIELPPNCKAVVSTIEVPAALQLAGVLEVDSFLVEEADQALKLWLDGAGRTLQDGQRQKVLASFQRSPLPLYLKLAFEEARLWRSFDPLEECALGEGLAGMIDRLFSRLAEQSNHGPVMVSHALGYLNAARYGLAEDEILALLSADDEVWDDFLNRAKHKPPQRRLPVIVWSRLYLDLEPYLTERVVPGGTVIAFYHRQLAARVTGRFPARSELQDRQLDLRLVHGRLASYFGVQADPAKDQSWKGANTRPFGELPYHLTHAGLWPRLDATLADPVYCEARVRTGGSFEVFELRSDCQHALQSQPSSVISVVERAITTGIGALLERPELCMQTLVNSLAWLGREEPVVKSAIERAMHVLDERGCWVLADSPYPRLDSDSPSVPFQIDAQAQCLSVDEECIVVLGEDRRIRLIDLNHGSFRDRRNLPEANGRVVSLQSIDSGDRVAWLDSVGVLRVQQSAQTLQVRRGQNRISFLPGHGLVAADTRGDLIMWNPDTGRRHVLAEALPDPVQVLRAVGTGLLLCVAGKAPQRVLVLTTDPQIELRLDLVWQDAQILDADVYSEAVLLLCRDRSLRRIGVRDGKPLAEPLRCEQGRPDTIRGAPLRCALGAESSDGWAFMATGEGQVGAWNWRSGELHRLPDWRTEQQRSINMFTCLRRSGQLVIGLQSEARLLTQSSRMKRERYHDAPVNACVVTDQGQSVSASEYDGTVCWFEAGSGLHLRVRQSHPRLTVAAAVPGSNDVLLGNGSGWCWRQPPDRDVSREEIFCLFDRQVAAVTSRDDRTIIAADVNGRTFLVEQGSENPVLLRHGSSGSVRQIALQPAGAQAVCWSLNETAEDGDWTYRLSLMEGVERETEILREKMRIVCIARVPDQDLICLGGHNVRLLKIQKGRKAVLLSRRETAVDFVSFVDDGQRLAVVRRFADKPPAQNLAGRYRLLDRQWLEVWGVKSGLPTVAAAHLPDQVTCFAARGDQILMGFESGEILRLRLRGQRADDHIR